MGIEGDFVYDYAPIKFLRVRFWCVCKARNREKARNIALNWRRCDMVKVAKISVPPIFVYNYEDLPSLPWRVHAPCFRGVGDETGHLS
jgi:hypothetical protein